MHSPFEERRSSRMSSVQLQRRHRRLQTKGNELPGRWTHAVFIQITSANRHISKQRHGVCVDEDDSSDSGKRGAKSAIVSRRALLALLLPLPFSSLSSSICSHQTQLRKFAAVAWCATFGIATRFGGGRATTHARRSDESRSLSCGTLTSAYQPPACQISALASLRRRKR